MNIYLLSKNSNYLEYWSSFIKESIVIDIEDVLKLTAKDILIVESSLYDPTIDIDAKLIVLDSEPTFETSVALLKDGVKAYGNIYMHSSHILSAIESLKEGRIWIYPNFIATMIGLSKSSNGDALEQKMLSLTSREKEIARLILDGLTNKEIAIRLEISPNTIKIHTKNIYDKLNVRDRLSLFALLK